MSSNHPFWRHLELGNRETYSSSLGELDLHLHRREGDWWVLSTPREDTEPPSEIMVGWRKVDDFDEVLLEEPGRVVRRHLFREAPTSVLVRPGLADRPVVVRPTSPTSVGPREEAVIYVGSPVWIVIETAEELLAALPAERLSDTWFGPSPRSGQLCYATRSRARLSLENLTPHEDKVVTRTTIRNDCGEPLDLDRWSLPVEFLSVYQGTAGWLWSESVTLTREHPDELARLEIDRGAPEPALSEEPLSPPQRERPDDSRFRAFGVRAIGALLRTP